jgi:Nickel/cobalt transporter regulator
MLTQRVTNCALRFSHLSLKNLPNGMDVMDVRPVSKWVFAVALCSPIALYAQSGNQQGPSGHWGGNSYHVGQPAPTALVAKDRGLTDYAHFHLRKPPEGYSWFRGYNSDYVLVSQKSGVVASITTRPNLK